MSVQGSAELVHTERVRFMGTFTVLCVLFSIGQFHRSAGGVLAPVFAEQLGLAAEGIGVVMGGMFVAQGLMQIPGGILINRYGTRRIVPIMAVVASAGSLLMAFSHQGAVLFLGRAMIGFGFATTLLGGYVLIQSWRGSERLSSLIGAFLFVGSIGSLCATYPLALAISMFDWRSVFVFLCLATLVLAALAYVVVRDRPSDLSPAEGEIGEAAGHPSFRATVAGFGEVLKNKKAWPALAVSLFLYAPTQVLAGLWAGPFLKDVHQVDALARSHILLVMTIAFALGNLAYGPIERFFNTRRSVILVGLSAIGGMLVLLAAIGYASLWASVILFVLILLAAPVFVVVFAHTQVLFPPHHASLVLPIINLLAITGIALVQVISGQIIGGLTHDPTITGSVLGYRTVFGLVGALFLVKALIYTRTQDIVPRPKG